MWGGWFVSFDASTICAVLVMSEINVLLRTVELIASMLALDDRVTSAIGVVCLVVVVEVVSS